MASYKVIFKPSVEKDLRSLPPSVVGRVFKHIEALKDEPFPRQSIKLAGAEQLYRIRLGDYRDILFPIGLAANDLERIGLSCHADVR